MDPECRHVLNGLNMWYYPADGRGLKQKEGCGLVGEIPE